MDLNTAVTAVMQQRFDWWTENDSLSLLVDLAGAGVSTSTDDYVPSDEHGIRLVYEHGSGCDGCRAIQSLAFDAIKGST